MPQKPICRQLTRPKRTCTIFTAAAFGTVQQIPLPITLSGTVFDDLNTNNKQEAGEPGIAGVTLTLYELNDGGNYVSTGKTATTDADGNYDFTASCLARIKSSKPSRTAI